MSKIDLSNVFSNDGMRVIISRYFPFPSHDDPEVFIHASLVEGTLYVSEEAFKSIRSQTDVLVEGSSLTII